MTQEISSLMDGELETPEAERAIRSCCASREAAEKWQEYHLIGEVMRGGIPHPTRTAERVREALAKEPAIVAAPRRGTSVARVALAAAASVATIGVVGWIGTQGGQMPFSGPSVARNPSGPAIQPVSNTAPVPAAGATIDQEYLAAHRRLPSVESYRPVNNRAAPAAAAR